MSHRPIHLRADNQMPYLHILPAPPIPATLDDDRSMWMYIMIHMNEQDDQRFGWTVVTMPSNPKPDTLATFYYIRRDEHGCTLYDPITKALNQYKQLVRDCRSCINVCSLLTDSTLDVDKMLRNAFKPGGGRWVHVIRDLMDARLISAKEGEGLKEHLWGPSSTCIGVPLELLDQEQTAWYTLRLGEVG